MDWVNAYVALADPCDERTTMIKKKKVEDDHKPDLFSQIIFRVMVSGMALVGWAAGLLILYILFVAFTGYKPSR